jgi:hypothetical protein
MASFVFGAAMLINVELDMYPAAPDHPLTATGEIYPINVNHGFIRYVTLQNKTRLDVWESRVALLCGPAMLAIFLLWVTFRDPSSRKEPGPRINMTRDSRQT